MKDKERDIFDDLCRSKLQDFEADTMPGDWEAIADRLAVKKSVPFRRTLRYWAAAAVISLLVLTGASMSLTTIGNICLSRNTGISACSRNNTCCSGPTLSK